ncbi:MAG TPA: hypothetical protein DHV36_11925 [Desulfobacteraceae bacterium]|nr:hypothetical protein [Desulfobacteraceae bacterium]
MISAACFRWSHEEITMNLLCIDPGTTHSGVVIFDGKSVSDVGTEVENGWLLNAIGLMDADHMAIEMVACYGMPVGKETFETCVWIGRFIEKFRGDHTKVFRKDVKLNLCNSMRAKDANIRQAAYEAMERIPSPKTAICLAQGLQDPVESVRMSAARAIDKNLSKPLVAGLKNIVRDGSDTAKTTVAALIDTEASNIFNFLVQEESFQALAKDHIVKKASPATRKNFLKHMSGIGQKELVNAVKKEVVDNGSAEEKPTKIIVVDDSKMMLRLYQNKLSALGFTPVTFHMPEEAIPAILQEKPDLVITDLNMPNISGLELTREIRRKYTRQDLPILMITTQSDFVEEKTGDIDVNDAILKKSGINKVLHKPFTDEAFRSSVHEFIPK